MALNEESPSKTFSFKWHLEGIYFLNQSVVCGPLFFAVLPFKRWTDGRQYRSQIPSSSSQLFGQYSERRRMFKQYLFFHSNGTAVKDNFSLRDGKTSLYHTQSIFGGTWMQVGVGGGELAVRECNEICRPFKISERPKGLANLRTFLLKACQPFSSFEGYNQKCEE